MHHAGVAVHPHDSVIGCGSSQCFQYVLTVVVVLKQPSLIINTSRELLQQSVLVDYRCFHLTSGASTSIRFLYWSPKQEALALNASRRVC